MSAPAPGAMLPPPEERLYASFQDLHEDLKKWTLTQGYALSIDASSNRDAAGVYRRYNMSCVKGGKVSKTTSQGKRRTHSKKTGCPMKIKCTKQDAWPWNGRWHITVTCGEHNHPPFNPDVPDEVPPAFRHIEGEGLRWLLIMHREAQLNLRQLTIGLRCTFGDKYRFVKKADVSNMLSKVKREEEREIAKRPPGAPPLPPGTMTAFMAALLNPVPDPYANGVHYEVVSATWPNPPGYQSAAAAAQQQQQQQQPLPPAPGQYPQQAFHHPQYAQPQQMQGPPPQYPPPQNYVPSQQPPVSPAYPPPASAPGQRPLQWKNYTPPAVATGQAPPVGGPNHAQTQQPQVQQQQRQQTQQQVQQPAQQQAPQQQQQQQPQAQPQPQQDPTQQQQPPQSQQQPPPQQHQQPAQQQPAQQKSQYPPPPTFAPQMQPHFAPKESLEMPATGGESLYRPTSTLQPVPVSGVPGAVVMPRTFSPVSEDGSDGPRGFGQNIDNDEDEDGDAESD